MFTLNHPACQLPLCLVYRTPEHPEKTRHGFLQSVRWLFSCTWVRAQGAWRPCHWSPVYTRHGIEDASCEICWNDINYTLKYISNKIVESVRKRSVFHIYKLFLIFRIITHRIKVVRIEDSMHCVGNIVLLHIRYSCLEYLLSWIFIALNIFILLPSVCNCFYQSISCETLLIRSSICK